MSKHILKNVGLMLGAYDFSGQANTLALDYGGDVHPATTLHCTNSVEKLAGLPELGFSFAGFWDATADGSGIDNRAIATACGSAQLMAITTPGTAVGRPAYVHSAILATYEHGGQIGTPHTVQLTGAGAGNLTRGFTLHRATSGIIATGASTPFQAGAVSAAQHLYAWLIAPYVDGTDPTMDVIVESDDAEEFTDPATRVTFTQVTARAIQTATPVAGAITDDWWRISYAIGGTDPDFGFTAIIAIA